MFSLILLFFTSFTSFWFILLLRLFFHPAFSLNSCLMNLFLSFCTSPITVLSPFSYEFLVFVAVWSTTFSISYLLPPFTASLSICAQIKVRMIILIVIFLLPCFHYWYVSLFCPFFFCFTFSFCLRPIAAGFIIIIIIRLRFVLSSAIFLFISFFARFFIYMQ